MPQSENWPFQRLLVDHLFHGTTRVWWSLDPLFNDAPPQSFQLQAGYTGNSNALDWVDVGSPGINAYYLDDTSRREMGGKRLLTHYRVVLATTRGQYVSGPQGIWGTLSIKDWRLGQEIVRKERLRLQLVSKDGYLLRKMRYGVKSTANTDTLTDEIIDSSYPGSWGTAFKVGYHPPVVVQADFENVNITEARGGDNIAAYSSRPAEFAARIVGFPDVAMDDVWIDAVTDQRWVIGAIGVPVSLRGVPLVYTIKCSLVPHGDIIYRIPVTPLSADPTDILRFQSTVGTGCVRVDHDYDEDSAMVYQAGDCCGIAGATVRAFLKTSWDLGETSPADAVASTQTTTNGTWASAMLLNPGTYIIQFEKTGEYGPDTVELEVTAPAPGVAPQGAPVTGSFGDF